MELISQLAEGLSSQYRSSCTLLFQNVMVEKSFQIAYTNVYLI
jgi:hypothetical protein